MEVCIVDDNPVVAAQLGQIVKREGASLTHQFSDAEEALAHCHRRPPDLVLVDYNMPDINGLEFISRLHADPLNRHSPVAMITGWALEGLRARAYEAGVLEVIEKPVWNEGAVRKLRSLVKGGAPQPVAGSPVWMEGLDQASASQYLDCLAELANASESARRQSSQVAWVSVLIAAACGMSAAHQTMLMRAAPLRNVGKLQLSTDLRNRHGVYSRAEMVAFQSHTTRGYELLRKHPSNVMQMAADVAHSHHERWDGTGYPLGLKGEAIPVSARIVAVAEALVMAIAGCDTDELDPVGVSIDALQAGAGCGHDPRLLHVLTDFAPELRALLLADEIPPLQQGDDMAA